MKIWQKSLPFLDNFGFIQKVDHNTGNDYGFLHFDSMNDAQTAVDTLSTFSLEKTNLYLQIEPCPTMKCDSACENEDDNADDQCLVLPKKVPITGSFVSLHFQIKIFFLSKY